MSGPFIDASASCRSGPQGSEPDLVNVWDGESMPGGCAVSLTYKGNPFCHARLRVTDANGKDTTTAEAGDDGASYTTPPSARLVRLLCGPRPTEIDTETSCSAFVDSIDCTGRDKKNVVTITDRKVIRKETALCGNDATVWTVGSGTCGLTIRMSASAASCVPKLSWTDDKGTKHISTGTPLVTLRTSGTVTGSCVTAGDTIPVGVTCTFELLQTECDD